METNVLAHFQKSPSLTPQAGTLRRVNGKGKETNSLVLPLMLTAFLRSDQSRQRRVPSVKFPSKAVNGNQDAVEMLWISNLKHLETISPNTTFPTHDPAVTRPQHATRQQQAAEDISVEASYW